MLNVQNLTAGYHHTEIISHITFAVETGDVVAIIGANGSGKTTLLKTLGGLVIPWEGSIHTDRKNIRTLTSYERAQTISFLPQDRSLPDDLTVEDYLLLGRIPYAGLIQSYTRTDYEKVNEIAHLLHLEPLMKRYCKYISGGEKQRTQIARVLVQDTPLILLDEPVNNLDLKYQWDIIEIIRTIKKLNKTFLIVIHDLYLVKHFCNKVLLLKNGKLFGYGGLEVLNKKSIEDLLDISHESHLDAIVQTLS